MKEKKQIATMWILTVLIVILIAIIVGLYVKLVQAKKEAKLEIERQREQTRQEVQTQMQEENKAKKIDDTKDWVYDADYKKYTYDDSYTTTYNETYYAKDIIVPYINIYSADASKVNNEIKEIMEKVVNVYNEGTKDKVRTVDVCEYKKYVNNNILSVMLEYGFGPVDGIRPTYKTYNFDLLTGQLLSYEEIYKDAGYNTNTIEKSVKDAITNVMKEKMAAFKYPENFPAGTNFDTYNNESILNYQNSIKNNTLEYFLDSNKNLNVVVTLSIPAENGKFDTIIKVSENNDTNTQENDKNNVKFTETEIKQSIQNYLDLRGALDGSPVGFLKKLGFEINYDETLAGDEHYYKTDYTYLEYKQKMLNYVTEEWFENKFTRLVRNVDGILYYENVGGSGEKTEVESVSLKGDYSNLSYIASVYDVHFDETKEQHNVEFHIANYNNKCVISYCDR